ncbi:MAG: hypothetical protein WDW38_004258 [Sanguina aurantia]
MALKMRQSVSVKSSTQACTPVVSLRPTTTRNCFQTVSVSRASTRSSVRVEASVRPVVAVAQMESETALAQLPPMYHWYETMLILKSNLSEDNRDKELAKFETFLSREQCMHINALVRGRNKLAYPVKGESDAMYVVYTYAAKRSSAKAIQLMLSKPDVGSEGNILRHISFCKL